VSQFSIVEQPLISDEVFAQLRRAILDGTLPSGTRLVESQIAIEMGVSRAPVREALRRLQQEDLVVNSSRRGQYVKTIGPLDIQQMVAVRGALEETAIRAIIDDGDPDAVAAELEELVAAMADAAKRGDLAQVGHLEYRFHEVICQRASNPYLAKAFEAISVQIRLGLLVANRAYADPANIAVEHTPLVAVIRSRKLSSVRDVVQLHLWNDEALLDPGVKQLRNDRPP
jgi:DNA-binding GntR family transcriptional regulator